MKEHEYNYMDKESCWWTIRCDIYEDTGDVHMFVTEGGIVQDIYPHEVAAAALIKWSQWLNEK